MEARRRKTSRQTVRVKTTWVTARCLSWLCNCPLPARLGGGKGSRELPKSIRYALPRVTRSLKETWLVWILSASFVEGKEVNDRSF